MSDSFIPLCVPEIRGNEWRYVKDCLDTGWVSSAGNYVDRFENMVHERPGMRLDVAAVNGTSALHVSLLAAGVQPEDEVLVSTLTFIAPANAIRYVGAWPVFVDAEPDYWQIDPAKVAHFLEQEGRSESGVLRNRATGRRVSALLPIHALAHPAQMEALASLARKFNLAIVGDATESLGVLGPRHRIGSDFTIYQGVTLGQRRNYRSDEFLTIGDQCTFFAGSAALGTLTIGDDVRLAANAVLFGNAEASSTCAGAPAVKVK